MHWLALGLFHQPSHVVTMCMLCACFCAQAEKQLVKNISKLKSQREKIREFQGAQEGLGQLEAEAKKLKAVIDEVRSSDWTLGLQPIIWTFLHGALCSACQQALFGCAEQTHHLAFLTLNVLVVAAVSLQIDSEVNILRGERDQAKDIIDDLSKKLNAVNAVIDEFQSERQVGLLKPPQGCAQLLVLSSAPAICAAASFLLLYGAYQCAAAPVPVSVR